MVKIAHSILSADFAALGKEIDDVEAGGADYIHVDVMDGHFVPNITIGPLIVEAIGAVTNLPLDVHLMIEEPARFIADFAKAGADIITVHQETCRHLHRSIHLIQEWGAKPRRDLRPATTVETVKEVLPYLDMVLLMTVNPGFGGQKFIPEVLPKISYLDELRKTNNYSFEIEIDGG